MAVKNTFELRKPPEYTPEQLEIAVDMAAKGESLRDIITAICSSEYDFWLYKQHYPDYNNKFEQARQEGLEHVADGLLTIADEYQDVQRGRLKSDNAKWLLSKRKPAVYGDKVDIHVTQTIDISAALDEAKRRALPQPLNETSLDDIKDVTPMSTEGMPKK